MPAYGLLSDDHRRLTQGVRATGATSTLTKRLHLLPPLTNDAPPQLRSAFDQYEKARLSYHDADTQVMAAENEVINAATQEGNATRTILLKGGDVNEIPDFAAAAQTKLRRAAAVLFVCSEELRSAWSRVTTVVNAYRDHQLASLAPMTAVLAGRVREAQRTLNTLALEHRAIEQMNTWWSGPRREEGGAYHDFRDTTGLLPDAFSADGTAQRLDVRGYPPLDQQPTTQTPLLTLDELYD